MITPYQKPEGKDPKATSFWNNLAGKLGLQAPLAKTASAEEKAPLLSDGIQTQAKIEARPVVNGSREASISRVSEQNKVSEGLLNRYAGVFHRAVAELGQTERVKAADRLSRIEADMAAFKDKASSFGSGDKAMADLTGEVSAKADAISGACVQLRDKVDALSMSQAASIENAFLVLSDAKTALDEMQGAPGIPGADLAMSMEVGLPEAPLELGDEAAEEPSFPGAEAELPPGMAARRQALVKHAADAAYDDLRMVHTKLCLVESMLSSLVSELNVSGMLSPETVPGMPPEGMPPMEEMEGEQKDQEMPLAEASLKGRMSAFAASGDPGDREPGNTIYKVLNKCRDCVWFESDFTHETYRDKCKHCTHASMGGAVEHFWPRSQQMVVWSPAWTAPQAAAKKAFSGSLSLSQTASKVSAAAAEIAADIVANAAHTAVDLGTELMTLFLDPVIARSMPLIAHEIAAEIKSSTGIDIALTAAQSKAWGRKSSSLQEGEVVVACDAGMVQLAKGEKRKIKELRQQLEGEKDSTKIKSLNDAIDSLYSRMDSDKERREKSKASREEKRKKQQEELAAKTPDASSVPVSASKRGATRVAAASAGTILKEYADGFASGDQGKIAFLLKHLEHALGYAPGMDLLEQSDWAALNAAAKSGDAKAIEAKVNELLPKYQDQVGQTAESIKDKLYGKASLRGTLSLRQAMPRQVPVDLFKFDELSPNAKEKAKYEFQADEGYSWADDALESLKKLAEHFGGKLVDYSIDWFGGSYSDAKFQMPEEMDEVEIKQKLDELGSFNPETLMGNGDCKLTGVFCDESAIDGLRKAFMSGERDLNALMQAAFKTWLADCQSDANGQYEDDQFSETCEANGYEFYESGKMASRKHMDMPSPENAAKETAEKPAEEPSDGPLGGTARARGIGGKSVSSGRSL